MTSSRVGVTCLSRRIALLACLMSTQIRTLSDSLGFTGVTMGDIQGVGPSIPSMMPFSRRRFNSSSTFFAYVEWYSSMLLSRRFHTFVNVKLYSEILQSAYTHRHRRPVRTLGDA